MGISCKTEKGPVKVIRKDGTSKSGKPYTLYSIMYSYKQDEEYKNVFLDASFRKGTDIPNKCKIEIKDAFMTGSEFNGNTKPKLFISDFTVVEGGEAQKNNQQDFVDVNLDEMQDLPFN